MTLFGPDFPPRERRTIAPGAIHLPGWLDTRQQRRLVQAFRTWSTGPVPIRAASLPSGHRMSVRTVCLGWHWQPYRYTRTADDVNGHRVLPFPEGAEVVDQTVAELSQRGVTFTYPAWEFSGDDAQGSLATAIRDGLQ